MSLFKKPTGLNYLSESKWPSNLSADEWRSYNLWSSLKKTENNVSPRFHYSNFWLYDNLLTTLMGSVTDGPNADQPELEIQELENLGLLKEVTYQHLPTSEPIKIYYLINYKESPKLFEARVKESVPQISLSLNSLENASLFFYSYHSSEHFGYPIEIRNAEKVFSKILKSLGCPFTFEQIFNHLIQQKKVAAAGNKRETLFCTVPLDREGKVGPVHYINSLDSLHEELNADKEEAIKEIVNATMKVDPEVLIIEKEFQQLYKVEQTTALKRAKLEKKLQMAKNRIEKQVKKEAIPLLENKEAMAL